MITEFVIAAGLQYGYVKVNKFYQENKWKNKEIKPYIKEFDKVCHDKEADLYLLDGEITRYGAKFVISLKNYTFEALVKLKEIFEIAFECEVELEQNENKMSATMDIIKVKHNDAENKYEPIKVEPYEIYIGEDNKFRNMVVNMNNCPHAIVSGSTGSGKSELLKLMISNSLYFNNESKLQLDICNVGNTGDFDDFRNCKQVKSFTESYDEIYKQFEYISNIYDNRMETFRRYKVKNIVQFNKKFKDSEKEMPYRWLIIDEIASLYPSSAIDKNKAIKEELFNSLCDMGRRFRKVGIFLILGIQRPSKTVFNPELKQNIGLKISFNQNNNASSLVATDSDKVAKIGRRKFLIEYDCDEYWARSLYINDIMIRKNIRSHIVKDRMSLNDFNVFLKIEDKKEEAAAKKKENKKGKAIAARPSKKTVELEVATTNTNEPDKTRIRKKAIVEEIDGYDIVDGHICIRIHRQVE